MKKIFYLSFAALAIAGCSKELQNNEVENPVEPKVLNTYHVSANLDQTKVNIKDDLSVVWQTNDQIGLVDENGKITPATVDETGVGKPSATFSYEAESEIDVKYAYYPYTETDGVCNQKVEGTTLTISLSNSQNMAKTGSRICQNNLIMAGQADGEGNIQFKNACAVVRIKLSGDENYVRRVFVQTPDKKVSGTGTLNLADENPIFQTAEVNEVKEVATSAALAQRTTTVVVNPWNGANNRIHVTAEGAEATDENFEGDVYVVLPAGEYTNFTIETLGNTDASSTEAATAVDLAKTSSATLTLNAGKIRTINAYLANPAATDLGKRANSFLIQNKEGGVFSFTTEAGGTNYESSKQNIVTKSGYYATLLWEDAQGLVTNVRNDCINHKIYFTLTEGKKGNAVIALRARDGKIQWSWHIWVAGEDVENRKFGTVEFMDRNLGALAVNSGTVADAGMHYEWGRKDPFPGAGSYAAANGNSIQTYPDITCTVTSQSGQGISWATSLPYVYIWGSTNNSGAEDWCSANPQDTNMWGNWGTTKPKTIYDPCPYGYRVPNGGAFSSTMIAAIKTAAITNRNKKISDDNGADFYIPTCGYWRRATNSTEMCNIGTHAWLWTMTSNASTDVVNTSYVGAACFTTSNNAAAVTRKTPRRWGANIRCVKFDEDAVAAVK